MIQRYKINYDDESGFMEAGETYESPDGEWVRYEDIEQYLPKETAMKTAVKEQKEEQREKGVKVEREHAKTYQHIKDFYEQNDKFPEPDQVYNWIFEDHYDEFSEYYDGLDILEEVLKKDELGLLKKYLEQRDGKKDSKEPKDSDKSDKPDKSDEKGSDSDETSKELKVAESLVLGSLEHLAFSDSVDLEYEALIHLSDLIISGQKTGEIVVGNKNITWRIK